LRILMMMMDLAKRNRGKKPENVPEGES